MKFGCILFDLDGTLVDSRADLVFAVNLMLSDLGFNTLPHDQVVSFVGEGILKLVERALAVSRSKPLSKPELDAAMNIFRDHYSAHLLDRTVVYPGTVEALRCLSVLPLGVVTNKPYDFTMAILTGLGLARFFKTILGGDSVPEKKPSPVPLLNAAAQCHVIPSECLMIGDSRIDILAGKAAEMTTAGFAGGFRGRAELQEAGADFIFDSYVELVHEISSEF
jgi:phosphoglycolate phosphatase